MIVVFNVLSPPRLLAHLIIEGLKLEYNSGLDKSRFKDMHVNE